MEACSETDSWILNMILSVMQAQHSLRTGPRNAHLSVISAVVEANNLWLTLEEQAVKTSQGVVLFEHI